MSWYSFLTAPLYKAESPPEPYGDNQQEYFRKALSAATAQGLSFYDISPSYFMAKTNCEILHHFLKVDDPKEDFSAENNYSKDLVMKNSRWIAKWARYSTDPDPYGAMLWNRYFGRRVFLYDFLMLYSQRNAFLKSALDTYMGLMFGRMYFVRTMKNNFKYEESQETTDFLKFINSISLDSLGNEKVRVFVRDRLYPYFKNKQGINYIADKINTSGNDYTFSSPRNKSSRFFKSTKNYIVTEDQKLPNQPNVSGINDLATITISNSTDPFYYSTMDGNLYKGSLDENFQNITTEKLNTSSAALTQSHFLGFHIIDNIKATYEFTGADRDFVQPKNADGDWTDPRLLEAGDIYQMKITKNPSLGYYAMENSFFKQSLQQPLDDRYIPNQFMGCFIKNTKPVIGSFAWYPITNFNLSMISMFTPFANNNFTDKVVIPVASTNKLLVITPSANVLALNKDKGNIIPKQNNWNDKYIDDANVAQKARRMAAYQVLNNESHTNPATEGVVTAATNGNLPTEDGLLQPRAACQDLAMSDKWIAAICVGRYEPATSSEPVSGSSKIKRISSLSIDPYDGSNYFFYLKLTQNQDLTNAELFLNAERGMEGQNEDVVNKNVLCTDMMLDDKDGFLQYVSFDKNENLFILTSNGAIYYYTADFLNKGLNGLAKPTKLAITGIDQPNFISCGDGIVSKDKDDYLFYLTDADIKQYFKDKNSKISWKPCSNGLQASTFALSNDGILLTYTGPESGQLYAFNKDQYATTVQQIIDQFGDNNVLKIACLCHLIARKPDRTYFEKTLPLGFYPKIIKPKAAVSYLMTLQNFALKLPANFWKNNENIPDFIQTDVFDKMRTDFEKDSTVIQTLNMVEKTIFGNSTYARKVSFRTKVQDIDKLLSQDTNFDADAENLESLIKFTKQSLSEVKSSIDELVKNKDYTINDTGYTDIEDLLGSKEDKPGTAGKPGTSLLLEWLHSKKHLLVGSENIDPAISEDDFKAWEKILQQQESSVYLESDTLSAETSLASIQSALALIKKLLTRDDIGSKDKTSLADACKNLFAYKNYLSAAEISEAKENLIFLKNKFSLDKLKAGNQTLADLINNFYLDCNVLFFVDQFKAALIDLTAEKIPTLISILSNIVLLKSDFELLTLKKDFKNNFITFLTDQLSENEILKKYQDEITEFNKDNLLFYLASLQDNATVKDFVSSLKEIAKVKDVSKDQQKLAIAIINLFKDNGWCLNQASLNDIQTVFNLQAGLNSKIANLPTIKISPKKHTFQAFIQNRFAEINNNLEKNTTTKTWSIKTSIIPLSKDLSLSNFWQLLKNYQEFNPNLNSNADKFQLIALCKYVLASIDYFLAAELSDAAKKGLYTEIKKEVETVVKKIMT